ncbi:hypothetical protein H5410_052343 [Solanum commersonii]|uniref:G-patch domain-containing protein n=1 Tax=Solanum commersonii TaxID=4109 RepID=A0A9J5X342_SOLCO|nr:hypothetical protein H5410_052343 [Solanum commersonii]
MKESEMIEVFLQAQEPNYFHYLLSAVEKTFAEVIKVGEMVENDIKSEKIPRPQYKKGNRVKDEFTPIGESHASLFKKLRTLNVLSPIERKMSNPPPRNIDYSQHYAYCSDASGHNIERCWHTETNMLEMMNDCKEVVVPYKLILKVGTGMENSANVVDLTKTMPSGVERTSKKLSPSNTAILTVKGALEDAWARQREARLIVPRRPNKPILIVQGAYIPLVIIRLVSQLSMTNPKTIPWNYGPTVVTYKGKEVNEEVDKANNENETLVYQTFEVVVAEHILEGNLISKPQLPMASMMMVNEMLKHGFESGKSLGIFLQGRAYSVSPQNSLGTFGLGYEPRFEDKMKAKKQKRDVWSLTKPIPPIYKSFIKARTTESSESPFPEPVLEINKKLINYFQDLFVEVDMVELEEGTSGRDVLLIGPDVQLNN